MNFHFECRVTPFDFLRMSLRKIYRSPVGICNIVFTAAMLLLAYRFFGEAGDLLQALMVLAVLLFPVIQPIILYVRAKGQAAMIPKDLVLDIDGQGVRASSGGKSETVGWKRFKQLMQTPGMVVLRMDNNAGYFIPRRAMGSDRAAFIEFAQVRIG